MTRIYEKDRLNAGSPQLILENELISVLLQPALGGRILDVETQDFPFLHRTYPKAVQFGPYTEYGGIEECIGSPLTSRLWSTPWRVEKNTRDVTLSAISATPFSKVLISKTLTLDPDLPILKIEYSFTNFDPKFNKFTFGIHPELCLGNALKDNRYHLPGPDGIVSGSFTQTGFKQFVVPYAGWQAVTCNGMVFGMLFPPDVIDNVEVYYPRIGTHFVVQPLIYGVGLSPNRRASFVCLLYLGEGDVDTVQELYESKADALTTSYCPIDAPLQHQVEDGYTQQCPPVTLPFEELGQLAPHDRQALHLHAPQPPTVHGTQEAIPVVIRELRRFEHHEITGFRLSNISGDIFIEAWDGDGVELETVSQAEGLQRTEALKCIDEARPDVIQHGKALLIHAKRNGHEGIRVNQSLRVPCEHLNTLELNFVRGQATLVDISVGRLKISSMEGHINISGPIAEGADYDISSTSGNIDVRVPDSAAATINAHSVTGAVKCDLDLIDADGRANWINGVYNAPGATLRLNSVSGNIRLSKPPTPK